MPDSAEPGATLPLKRTQMATESVRTVSGSNPDALMPYLFGAEIARGGMGSILEAEDCKLPRTVAVKIILSEIDADEDQKQRFLNEAAVLARLAHPNIVPVYDIGRDAQGQLYYSMKLVKGRTLQAIINDLRKGGESGGGILPSPSSEAAGKMPLPLFTLDRLLTIFRKVCDAMAFAHSQGIIHRDLKPENVMVGEFGEVLVMDWGLAKMLNDECRMTNVDATAPDAPPSSSDIRHSSFTATLQGSVMGTPQYMSPEQAEGRISDMDERSDIFSLGGILYCILTLRPPVEGKTLDEVLKKVAGGSITPPSAFGAITRNGNPGAEREVLEAKRIKPLPHCPGGRVPAALSAVVMQALAVQREKRYPNVAAFSADIEAYQGGFATSAEHASLIKQIFLLIQRHKGVFTTTFAAWLVITALALWFVINLRTSERAAREAEAIAVQERESARQALAKSALNLAEAAQREGNGPEMQAALNEVPDDLRDSTWNYLLEQSDTSIARVHTGTGELDGVAAHPRLPGVFAIGDRQRKVTLLNVRTGARLLEFAPAFPAKTRGDQFRLAFSPDGARIAVGRDTDGGIVIHSAQDGTKLLEFAAPASRQLEFSPDGALLLQTDSAKGNRHLLRVWDTTGGHLLWADPPDTAGFFVHGVFTPDGKQILKLPSKNEGGTFQLINARDGAIVRTFKAGLNPITELVIRAHGTAVAADRQGLVTVFDTRDGSVLTQFRAHNTTVSHLALTPTGGQIVTAVPLLDGRQALHVWRADTGEQIQTLLGGSGEIRDIQVHPLTGELLVSGPNARAWSLMGAPEKWALRFSNIRECSIGFWGSDDVVFAPAPAHRFALQDLKAGNPEVLWKTGNEPKWHHTVSADGRIAAVIGSKSEHTVSILRNPGPQPEQVGTLTFNAGRVDALRLSARGDKLAISQDSPLAVRLYDTATGRQPVSIERVGLKKFWDIAWLGASPQLVGLATAVAERGNPGAEERVVVWDAATGKPLRSATNRSAMNVLAVAPDGRRFAEAGVDKLVRIRDAETLAVQQEFRAHDGPVTALAWHPSKPIIASGSTDLTIRIWDIDTGRKIEELRGPIAEPRALEFSPSGHRLGCAAKDGVTRIWEPRSLNEKPATPQETDGWEDVLATLTPAIVARTGNGWRMEGGALSSPGSKFATLPLPGNFAGASYQVRVKLRQLAAKESFVIILPVGDRMAASGLDAWPKDGYYSGVSQVNGENWKDLPGAVAGRQVKDSEQHDLEVTVRLDGPNIRIIAALDAEPLYEWTGPTASLSLSKIWVNTPPGSFALGTMAADWVVYEVKVKRPNAK